MITIDELIENLKWSKKKVGRDCPVYFDVGNGLRNINFVYVEHDDEDGSEYIAITGEG